MKYIVLRYKLRKFTIEQPYIFPHSVNHDDMAYAMMAMLMRKYQISAEVVSAGFCNFYGQNPHCEGSSVTLAIGSREEDNKLIRMFNYEQGIKG